MKLDIVTQQYWNDRHSDLHRIPFINILNCHFVHRYNRNKNKDWTINLMLFMFKYFLLMNGVKENKRHFVDHSNTYLLRIFRKIFQPTFLLPYNQIIENIFHVKAWSYRTGRFYSNNGLKEIIFLHEECPQTVVFMTMFSSVWWLTRLLVFSMFSVISTSIWPYLLGSSFRPSPTSRSYQLQISAMNTAILLILSFGWFKEFLIMPCYMSIKW